MFLKKIYKNVLVFVAITFFCSGCLSPIKKETQIAEQTPEQTVKNINRDNIKRVEMEKKQDLYPNTSYELPLFSIIEISKLDSKLKKIVDKLLEDSQGFYYLKVIEDGVFIILQHPVSQTNTYSRHDLQFVKISKDGNITYHTAGYSGIDGEIYSTESKVSESWVYDNEQEFLRPIKHTVYNENGKEKFTEFWNYNETEPIKYQMKDNQNKTISVLKISQDSDYNLRKEHVFYDNNGNIKMSLTINYDGANISRLTFYNTHELLESVMILTEYLNEVKVKELIYNQDYHLINTVVSKYKDDLRSELILYDAEEKEINKICS